MHNHLFVFMVYKYKKSYTNKRISIAPDTLQNYHIISNYTQKINITRICKIIIPNSVNIFINSNNYNKFIFPNYVSKHNLHNTIVSNNVNKYNLNYTKNVCIKKKLLNIINICSFCCYGINVNNFLFENINKIITFEFRNHNGIIQNMLYLKNIKNVTMGNYKRYFNVLILKNIYSFSTYRLTKNYIQNIFALNNTYKLCVLVYDTDKFLNIDHNRFKSVHTLHTNVNLFENIDTNNLLYVSILINGQYNITKNTNIYVMALINKLYLISNCEKTFNFIVLKYIKNNGLQIEDYIF